MVTYRNALLLALVVCRPCLFPPSLLPLPLPRSPHFPPLLPTGNTTFKLSLILLCPFLDLETNNMNVHQSYVQHSPSTITYYGMFDTK